MAQISIQRHSTVINPDNESYRLTLQVTAATDITEYIFVNQRIRNYTNNTSEDSFAAIATPAQLEDFGQDAPLEGSTYFRTNKVDIVSRNAAYLEDVFQDIINQVKKLVQDVEGLAVLADEGTYQISATDVTIT